MAITNLTGTKWLLPESLNSTSYIADDFDIDISPYKIELNTLLKLQYSSGELDSITTWEELLDIAPYIINNIGGTNVVNNLVVENDKNNYLIVPTMGYLKISSSSNYLYYGLDLALADNLPIVSGIITFEHPINGTMSVNFVELFHLFFNTSATGYWSEIPIPPGGTMLDPLLSTMTITGGDDVTNPTLIAWLEENATQIKTISDKLQDLLDIKQDIKVAIENKGVDLTDVDFSGYAEKIDEIQTGGAPEGETWVINESPRGIISGGAKTITVDFVSNNTDYSSIYIPIDDDLVDGTEALKYDNTQAYRSHYWYADGAYRTLTFETAPTGELLEWLQANAVKIGAVVELTQAQYDALSVYDSNTYYLIYEKVLPQGDTWVMNEIPTVTSNLNATINFVSNETNYTSISLKDGAREPFMKMIYYNDKIAWVEGSWSDGGVYRTITFETEPTGDLLTWLEANAVKQ